MVRDEKTSSPILPPETDSAIVGQGMRNFSNLLMCECRRRIFQGGHSHSQRHSGRLAETMGRQVRSIERLHSSFSCGFRQRPAGFSSA
ncbi:unnamed protein product, partial [Nesidiocoris tenuis]